MSDELPTGWRWVLWGDRYAGPDPLYRAEKRIPSGAPGRQLKWCDARVVGTRTHEEARRIVVISCWRDVSDDRGMEAVEAEAREMNERL